MKSHWVSGPIGWGRPGFIAWSISLIGADSLIVSQDRVKSYMHGGQTLPAGLEDGARR